MSVKRTRDVKWDPDRLSARVAELAHRLPRAVRRIRYNLGEDWSGDPVVFFRVLLSDPACRRQDRLYALTKRLQAEIEAGVGLDLWTRGMPYPHFTWRSESEQRLLKEKSWE